MRVKKNVFIKFLITMIIASGYSVISLADTANLRVSLKDRTTGKAIRNAIIQVKQNGVLIDEKLSEYDSPSNFSLSVTSAVNENTVYGNSNFHLRSIYPNPGIDNITLKANLKRTSGELTIRIYNILGELAASQQISGHFEDEIDIRLDISFLSTGIYLVELVDSMKSRVTGKFLKLSGAKSSYSGSLIKQYQCTNYSGKLKKPAGTDTFEIIAYTDTYSTIRGDNSSDVPISGVLIDTVEITGDVSITLDLEKKPIAIDGNYKAPYTSLSPEIDGNGSEECWEKAPWSPLDQLWLGSSPSENDFSGQFKVVWTENKIYYLVEITDNQLSDQYGDPLDRYWEDDCLEIFIDEDRSGGDHTYNFNAFAYHIALDYNVVDLGTNRSPALFNEHLTVQRTDEGNISTWEIAMDVYDDSYSRNSANSPVDLYDIKRIGLAVAYCDNDGKWSRESFMGSIFIPGNDKNVAWMNADVFGTLELINTD